MTMFDLDELQRIIAERARSGDPDSWTARIVAGGIDKAAQKLGEEAVETVIAAIRGDRNALIRESADLVYHWMVMLAVADIPLADIVDELERRTGQSGLAEKASRPHD